MIFFFKFLAKYAERRVAGSKSLPGIMPDTSQSRQKMALLSLLQRRRYLYTWYLVRMHIRAASAQVEQQAAAAAPFLDMAWRASL